MGTITNDPFHFFSQQFSELQSINDKISKLSQEAQGASCQSDIKLSTCQASIKTHTIYEHAIPSLLISKLLVLEKAATIWSEKDVCTADHQIVEEEWNHTLHALLNMQQKACEVFQQIVTKQRACLSSFATTAPENISELSQAFSVTNEYILNRPLHLDVTLEKLEKSIKNRTIVILINSLKAQFFNDPQFIYSKLFELGTNLKKFQLSIDSRLPGNQLYLKQIEVALNEIFTIIDEKNSYLANFFSFFVINYKA